MVPGPESNNSRERPICIKTEHELRLSDGTQVPEPNIVTFIPIGSDGIFKQRFLFCMPENISARLRVALYSLFVIRFDPLPF
jgi:hypothetical protein